MRHTVRDGREITPRPRGLVAKPYWHLGKVSLPVHLIVHELPPRLFRNRGC